MSVGAPAGQATLPGGTVVGAFAVPSGSTVVQVVATRPVAVIATEALKCPRTAWSGTALVAWSNSVSLLIRL